MDIQLETKTVLQLQEMSKEQDREISVILKEAIEYYVEQHTNETVFRETVRHIMEIHQWLLHELEKQ